MFEIIEAIIAVVFILGFSGLGVLAFKLKRINDQMSSVAGQLAADNKILSEEIQRAQFQGQDKKVEETEGFLKFVSQSRDWAFQYIERVQITIKNFQDVAHPIAVQYYENKDQPINQEELGKLLEAYKKLVEELPDEGKK